MRSVYLFAAILRECPNLKLLDLKPLLLNVVFILLAIVDCYCQTSYPPSIKANIHGLENDTVFVLYSPLSGNHALEKDTIFAKNNSFTYHSPLNEPTILFFVPQKAFYKRKGGGVYAEQTKFVELFLLPTDKIYIEGVLKDNYLEYLATGSKVNKTFSQFRDTYRNSAIKAVKVELRIDSLRNIKGEGDSVRKLFKVRGKYFSNIMKSKIQFVNQHLNNDLSAYFVSGFSPETFMLYYSKLTQRVREGMFYPALKNSYQNYLNFMSANEEEKKLKEGVIAPDFSLRSREGGKVSLSNYKGKIIVLDFWGTWCPPCMEELPQIKLAYEKYGSKVEFIGIACNETEEDWESAIKKHQLDWIQLFNSEKNDVSILYGVKGFPTKIIIGKDFKIIERYRGLNDDFYKQLNKLVK